MSMKRLFYILLVFLSLALLFSGIASAQDVLRLDEEKSYVLNLETGSKTSYTTFLESEQLEGNRLEFWIYVSRTENPVLADYVLELRTDMDNPEWKFGDVFSHSANWIVWEEEEHELPIPSPIILSADVPKPIRPVKEPGFESYDLKGISKEVVEVRLTVGRMRDENITYIQELTPSMKFFSTSEEIQNAQREIEKNLEEARGMIGKETDLEKDIWKLYEEGHPGWASILSEHYKEPVVAERQPLGLYALLSVIVGVILGSGFVYVYVSRGGGKGVDVSQISAELNETSGKIEEKSSSINAISTRFARSEDDEKRSVARDLIRIRASLNEISSEIRTIADRIKER
jgi:hypothetical protein